MSAYQELETEFQDQACLVQALEALFGEGSVSTYEKPAQLVGYGGDLRRQCAHVIVRRKHIGGSSNDMGFIKQDDGTYKMWLSEYDQIATPAACGFKNRDAFVIGIKKNYAVSKVEANAYKNNWSVKKTVDQDGKIRIKLGLPSYGGGVGGAKW